MCSAVFLLYPIRWHNVDCPITDDADFDHLIKMMSQAPPLWGYSFCLTNTHIMWYVSYSAPSFQFIQIFPCVQTNCFSYSMDSNLFYHSLFSCSNYSRLGQWEPLHSGFYVFLKYLYHSLSIFFHSGRTECSVLSGTFLVFQGWNQPFL